MSLLPKTGHTGHCDVLFKIVQGYKTQFGGHFDTLPFLTPHGDVVSGAELRVHRDGCGLWEAMQWDFVCQCTHDFDEMFVLRDEAGEPVARRHYRIKDDEGNVYTSVTNERGETQRVVTRTRRNLTLEVL